MKPSEQSPRVTVSERAKQALLAVLENPAECVRLQISPQFEHDLSVTQFTGNRPGRHPCRRKPRMRD